MFTIKKRTKLSVIMVLFVFCTIILSFVTSCSPDKAEINAKSCEKAIVEFCKTDADALKLADVTDFEWDTVYFFDGYTSNKEIEEATGIKNDIEPFGYDSKNIAIFVKNGNIVCQLVYGWEGFRFDAPYKTGISCEEANFKVITDKSSVIFKYFDKETSD